MSCIDLAPIAAAIGVPLAIFAFLGGLALITKVSR
jgi:hypothetical protein